MVQSLQPLERTFHTFGAWVDVSLAHRYCGMTSTSHDRKRVNTVFPSLVSIVCLSECITNSLGRRNAERTLACDSRWGRKPKLAR
jgi:hypothetical protein